MRYKSLPEIEDVGYADVEALRVRLQRQRLWISVIAAVLSAALHVAVALRLPRIVFPQVWESVQQRVFEPFKVAAVTPVPRETEPDRPGRARADSPGEGFNIKADALSFTRAVDEVKLAPQPLPSGSLEQAGGAPPVPSARDTAIWAPREEILKVEERLVKEDIPERPRRLIPEVTRIKGAADVALPLESPRRLAERADEPVLSELARRSVADARPPSVQAADTRWEALEDLLKPAPGPVLRSGTAEPAVRAIREEEEKVAALAPLAGEPLKPVEGLLKAGLRVFRDRSDPDYVYARIDIQRAGADALPVLPKDMLFIQDCSASITEQRLAFCREGLLRGLAQLSPRDRFNVVSFRETPERCFPDWAPATPANLETGRAFVRAMESKGNTDLYASLRELLAMDTKPVRPVVVVLVSDGLPTAGLRDSAEIISAFTRANAGAVSVFAMATFDQANLYLLDMLSYMNRGDSTAARRGRWSIPEVMDAQISGVSRPVLSDMRFRFSAPGSEWAPALTPHLYLDRALVLYGRVPKRTERVVFQVVGRSGADGCDMVFDLKLDEAAAGEASIREEWAWHKVYGLIGAHTLSRDPAHVAEIEHAAKAYGLRVPYAEELK